MMKQETGRYEIHELKALMATWGHPEDRHLVVHVAGTNGKGSTAAMVALMLAHCGWRVGLFTSPHVVSEQERFRLLCPSRSLDEDEEIPKQVADVPSFLKIQKQSVPIQYRADVCCEMQSSHLDALIEPFDMSLAHTDAYVVREWMISYEALTVQKRIVEQAILAQLSNDVNRSLADVSLFQIWTAMAYRWFDQMACDVLVMEAGIGGSLDATHITKAPKIAVITPLGADHLALLGGHMSGVVSAKLGIVNAQTIAACVYDEEGPIKNLLEEALSDLSKKYLVVRRPSVTLSDQLQNLIRTVCESKGAILSDSYMQQNATLASLAALESVKFLAFNNHQLNIMTKPSHVMAEFVRAMTTALYKIQWYGRLTILNDSPLILFDGAHNVHGTEALCQLLDQTQPHKRLNLVFGCLSDKPWTEILEVWLSNDRAFKLKRLSLIPVQNERSILPKQIQTYLENREKNRYNTRDCELFTYCHLMDAIQDLQQLPLTSDDVVVITGSLYLLPELSRVFN